MRRHKAIERAVIAAVFICLVSLMGMTAASSIRRTQLAHLKKTLGNHLCDLLQDGETITFSRDFGTVSGLSVTASRGNGASATLGFGGENAARKEDRDKIAELTETVLDQVRQADQSRSQ